MNKKTKSIQYRSECKFVNGTVFKNCIIFSVVLILFATSIQSVASAGVIRGAVNLDGTVNLLDVAPFVDVLSNGDFQLEADVNQDSFVNLLDVAPFIDVLTNGPQTEIVVLRDTIGPDNSVTNGAPSAFANTNLFNIYSCPAMRFTNTTTELAALNEVKVVVIGEFSNVDINEVA